MWNETDMSSDLNSGKRKIRINEYSDFKTGY